MVDDLVYSFMSFDEGNDVHLATACRTYEMIRKVYEKDALLL